MSEIPNDPHEVTKWKATVNERILNPIRKNDHLIAGLSPEGKIGTLKEAAYFIGKLAGIGPEDMATMLNLDLNQNNLTFGRALLNRLEHDKLTFREAADLVRKYNEGKNLDVNTGHKFQDLGQYKLGDYSFDWTVDTAVVDINICCSGEGLLIRREPRNFYKDNSEFRGEPEIIQ